jgi:hypothetical protein
MPVSSQGKIHDVFNDNLTQRASQAAQQAQAARGNGLRPWSGPTKVTDPLDVPNITKGFDRSEIDTNYTAKIVGSSDSPGTCGDTISVKTQGDFIAILERGYRARHCTPVRLLGMLAARRAGHGQPNGVYLGGILRYAQDTLQAGQSG